MAEIQGNILKRGKRNAITRRIHKKNDNEAITTWRLGLDRILHVFKVHSATSVWSLLTLHFQTELEVNMRTTVPDIRHDVMNTPTIISNVHPDASNADVRHHISSTHTIASKIHRNTLKGRESVGDRNSIVRTLSSTCHRVTNHHHLDSRQVGNLNYYRRIQRLIFAFSAPGESPLLLPRNNGSVPDIRRDIMKAGAIISEVHRDVMNTQSMVRDMLTTQEGAGGQDRLVSVTCTLFATEQTLTTA